MVPHLQYRPFLPAFLVLVRGGAVSAASLLDSHSLPPTALPHPFLFTFPLGSLPRHPGPLPQRKALYQKSVSIAALRSDADAQSIRAALPLY